VQMPLAIDNYSLPEPDIAVVVGSVRDYRDAHPTTAILVVEVADSSLEHDKGRKLMRYGAADIPEYWIINLRDYCLEVYQNPVNGLYQTRRVLFAQDTLAPLSHPGLAINVNELLP
jgi:Uma2 family endonuclease